MEWRKLRGNARQWSWTDQDGRLPGDSGGYNCTVLVDRQPHRRGDTGRPVLGRGVRPGCRPRQPPDLVDEASPDQRRARARGGSWSWQRAAPHRLVPAQLRKPCEPHSAHLPKRRGTVSRASSPSNQSFTLSPVSHSRMPHN